MSQGKLIVIDGMDGSGKGTQIELLKEKLRGHDVVFTREPGGTQKAEEIRELLLSGKNSSNPLADSLLFWASRALHIEQMIRPDLGKGIDIISDRFDSSTLAFQIYGEERHELIELFLFCRKLVMEDLIPHYIFLDLLAVVAYKRRMADVEQEKSKFDIKPLDYHKRVREGFRTFPPEGAVQSPVHIVDADRSPEEIHQDMWKIVSEILEL